jgi:gliding motility-associated-like protein
MKKIAALLFGVWMMVSFCEAQFSATGGSNGLPYVFVPLTGTGLDKVFVFKDLTNAKLIYSTSNPADWTWYRFGQNPATATVLNGSDVQTTLNTTELNLVDGDYGYFVQSSSGVCHYCFVVSYSPPVINDITFTTLGDVCTNLTLEVDASLENLVYYTTTAIRRTLTREFVLTWNTLEWNGENKTYETKTMTSTSTNLAYNWTVTAPLCNTYFTLSGDQYATYFGSSINYPSALYVAVAVKANAVAIPVVREAENELDKITAGEYTNGSSPSGPAPLIMDFYSYPSETALFFEWLFYDSENESGTPMPFSDENLNHTFLTSGKFLVKLYVSNNMCKDSARFTPDISESSLDCPNFFTPRSTPGENDEFRVAYRSLVSFKGTIINRWGNVLFEWSDPAKGWNGTFKGKAVSPGVYFYLIEAKGSDGIVYKKKGDINLLE